MKNKINLIIIIVISLVACTSTKKTYSQNSSEETTIRLTYKSHGNQDSYFSGMVVDNNNGEMLIGASIKLRSKTRNDSYSTHTDADGKFIIKNLAVGFYFLEFKSSYGGYFLNTEIEIKEYSNCFADIRLNIKPIMVEKPVIYLYPIEKQNIHIKLNYDGVLTHTYPKYTENGWTVTAEPNGTLWDVNKLEYYALFWEGTPNNPLVPENGFVVSGKETATFLEDKLAYLGLNRREANEFIMYWLPRMENNPYNFIHFAGKDYVAQATLEVNPKPETIIRVMMITKPLDNKINIPIQDLNTLKKTRKGFTLVEWGGSMIQSTIEKI